MDIANLDTMCAMKKLNQTDFALNVSNVTTEGCDVYE